MRVALNDEKLLLNFLSGRDTLAADRGFASEILRASIDPNTATVLKKTGIDQLMIFNIGERPLQSFQKKPKRYTPEYLVRQCLKGKVISYFKISDADSTCFGEPQFLSYYLSFQPTTWKTKRLKKRLEKLDTKALRIKHLRLGAQKAALNKRFVVEIARNAKKDYEFVKRYNQEIFFGHIFHGDRRLTLEEVNDAFIERTWLADLASTNMRIAFTALYGMGKGYFTFTDIYSVDGIFSFGKSREVDELKKRAGQEVFYLLMGDEKAFDAALHVVAGSAFDLTAPLLDIDNPELIKHNYSLYIGLADCGELITKLKPTDQALIERAGLLRRFDAYRCYYDEIDTADGTLLLDSIREFEALLRPQY